MDKEFYEQIRELLDGAEQLVPDAVCAVIIISDGGDQSFVSTVNDDIPELESLMVESVAQKLRDERKLACH